MAEWRIRDPEVGGSTLMGEIPGGNFNLLLRRYDITRFKLASSGSRHSAMVVSLYVVIAGAGRIDSQLIQNNQPSKSHCWPHTDTARPVGDHTIGMFAQTDHMMIETLKH